jgi:ankyrin repeat protein
MLEAVKIFSIILLLLLFENIYAQTEDSLSSEIILYYFEVDTSYFDTGQDDFNLILAAERDDLIAIEILLRRGADPDATTFDGVTPLMYASDNGNVEAVMLFLEHGADPNAVPDNGITALISASRKGYYDVSRILLDWGASVNKTDENKYSALMYAVTYDYSDLVELYLSYEADITQRDWFGSDPLIIAAYHGSYESAKRLLNNEANVNTKDNYGFTPLIVASQQGHYHMVWLLIDNGADIQHQTEAGYDALSLAILKGNKDITELLIESGADVNAIVDKGIKPLGLAKKKHDQEMISLLRDNNATSNMRPDFSSGKIGLGMNFNMDDFMLGAGFGLIDQRYGIELYGDFFFRPAAIRTLLPETEEWLYQYWEKRVRLSGALYKRFKICQNEKASFGAFLGLGLGYTWGSYRGADRRPHPETFLNPLTGLYWRHKHIGVDLKYEYADFKVHDFSPHRITLEFIFYLNMEREKLMYKVIAWE